MIIKTKIIRWLVAGLLGLLVVVAYSYALHKPAEPYFDEVHYVRFIRGLLLEHEYLETSNVHPPLWHLLTAFLVWMVGDFFPVWRLVSLAAGLLLFWPLFQVAKKITADHMTAWLAVFLLAFDCLSLTQARSAMMNSLMLVFNLFAVYYFLNAFPPQERVRSKSFFLCGIFLALALATKLVAASLLLFFVPLLILEVIKRRGQRLVILRNGVLALLVMPAAAYFGVHLFIPLLKNRTVADIWGIWKFHMNYNVTMNQTHGYSSRWWSWPLMLRPIWFYFQSIKWGTPASAVSGIIAIGNPAVFWMIPLMVVNLGLLFSIKRSRTAGVVLWGFFTQWLAFATMQRLQFFHYFYSVMPFVVIGMAMLVRQLWRWGGFWRYVVAFYLILVAGMFVYWYPLLTGVPVNTDYYHQHLWFQAWI